MNVNINLLDSASVDRGVAKIDKFIEGLGKLDEIVKRLAEIGVEVARARFDTASAYYDGVINGDAPIDVQLVKIEDGYQIQANGEAVCYLEFGAGVYYNGMGSYPNGETPSGIDGIGEHDTRNGSGVSLGMFQAWAFTDESGEKHITHGNPSGQALYNARIEMERQAEQIIKEVFR